MASGSCGASAMEAWVSDGVGSVVTGAGEDEVVEFSVEEFSELEDDDEELPSEAGGSGRCSRLDMLQRGHIHSRDLHEVGRGRSAGISAYPERG